MVADVSLPMRSYVLILKREGDAYNVYCSLPAEIRRLVTGTTIGARGSRELTVYSKHNLPTHPTFTTYFDVSEVAEPDTPT